MSFPPRQAPDQGEKVDLRSFLGNLIERDGEIRPKVVARRAALIFFCIGVVYILLSSSVSAVVSLSVVELVLLEMTKGFVFIMGMSLLTYFLMRHFLDQIVEHREELRNQAAAIIIAQKQASAGLLASSLGHDVNNIVQVLTSSVEQLGDSKNLNKDECELLAGLAEAAEHLAELARSLVTNAREKVPIDPEPIELCVLAQDVAKMLGRHRKLRHVTIVAEIPEQLSIRGNRVAIQQSLINLVLNAADAMEGRGQVQIFGKSGSNGQDENVCLEVHDSGPGIPVHLRDAVFSPLYTTKSEGNGLGLLSVKACTNLHGGWVEIGDSPLGGACFRLSFPAKLRLNATIQA